MTASNRLPHLAETIRHEHANADAAARDALNAATLNGLLRRMNCRIDPTIYSGHITAPHRGVFVNVYKIQRAEPTHRRLTR